MIQHPIKTMIKVTGLYCYPVKSLSGLSMLSAELDSFGIKHDRRWMLTDANGKFLSQRTHPQMALIKTSIVNNQLHLRYKDQSIEVPKARDENPDVSVTVWQDSFIAKHVSSKVDKFLTVILKLPSQLVFMSPQVQRQIDLDYAPNQHYVSFADAFPFLLTNQSSLDDLNQHLTQKAEMIRFRPNIVVKGCEAYSEDSFKEFTINKIELAGVKKCSRCPMPTVNPLTGKKDNQQILTVLNKFRKQNNKVYFGQNLIYKKPKNVENFTLNIGDELILK